MAFHMAIGVTPELLRTKAEEVSSDIEAMICDVQNMCNELNYTGYYWKGDAAELQKDKFNSRINEINSILVRARTYPVRILQMAGIYEQAEAENVSSAGALGTDLLIK